MTLSIGGFFSRDSIRLNRTILNRYKINCNIKIIAFLWCSEIAQIYKHNSDQTDPCFTNFLITRMPYIFKIHFTCTEKRKH